MFRRYLVADLSSFFCSYLRVCWLTTSIARGRFLIRLKKLIVNGIKGKRDLFGRRLGVLAALGNAARCFRVRRDDKEAAGCFVIVDPARRRDRTT